MNQLRAYWNNSTTLRNILKVSFGDATSKLFSVATTLLLIRGLSVTDYANYIAFSGISYLFSGIVGAGINMALVQSTAGNLSRGKEKPIDIYLFAILFELALYILLAIFCLLFPVLSARFLFGQDTLTLPLQMGLLSGLGLLVFQFGRTLYQAEERFNKYIGLIWLVQIMIFVGLAVFWLLNELSFLSVAILSAFIQLGIGIWVLSVYLSNHTYSAFKNFLFNNKNELKSFFTGSSWLIAYFVSLNLFSRMDILMLMRFKTNNEVAIYGVAFQYYSLALLLLGSIHAVLLPKFSKAEMQNNQSQRAFLKLWLSWSVWLIVPIILFDLLGKSLFVLVNGSTYESSFPILVIFSIGIWLSMMFSPLVNFLVGKREFRFLFTISCIALTSNVLINLLTVPLLGGIGAAITVVVSIGFINLASYIKIRSV